MSYRLLQGGDLYEALANQSEIYTEEFAANIIKQILSALSYMHTKKICHRDVKPENILFENNNLKTIKLIDFGVSSRFESNLFMSDQTGTAYYMSPDVIQKRYNEKCDIWSTGVILFLMLSGKPPYTGFNEDEILQNILTQTLNLSGKNYQEESWKGKSPEVKDLLINMLNPDSIKRFSAKDCLDHPWFNKIKNGIQNQENNSIALKAIKNFKV